MAQQKFSRFVLSFIFYFWLICDIMLFKEGRGENMSRTRKQKITKQERSKKMVNGIFKNVLPLLFVEASVFIVAALMMIFNPSGMLMAATFVVGAFLVVFGLYRIGLSFVDSEKKLSGSVDSFLGILSVVLGIIFCVFPHGVAIGVVYVFVVLFLLNALRLLFFSINLARVKYGNYVFDLVFSGVLVLVASVLLLLPGLAGGVLVFLLAAYLLIYALADIYMFVKLARLKRAVAQMK